MPSNVLKDNRSLKDQLGPEWSLTDEEQLKKGKEFFDAEILPIMKSLDIKRIRSYEKLANVTLR
ncbi:MAG: hypothetical protein HQL94_01825 [Magnetococcales bacterium]|nr:hypothetical protein [Magnetococcales bacterium]MBF0437869.1 hypothetical protein [Magnetococcales bacterium]